MIVNSRQSNNTTYVPSRASPARPGWRVQGLQVPADHDRGALGSRVVIRQRSRRGRTLQSISLESRSWEADQLYLNPRSTYYLHAVVWRHMISHQVTLPYHSIPLTTCINTCICTCNTFTNCHVCMKRLHTS